MANSKKRQEYLSRMKKEVEASKAKAIKVYVDIVKSGKILPTRQDLTAKGVNRDAVRRLFTTYANLRTEAKEKHPSAFKGVISTQSYLQARSIDEIVDDNQGYKTYVVSTAVSGQKCNVGFLNSIKTFCEMHSAKLLLLPSHDPAHNLDTSSDKDSEGGMEWVFDDMISPSNIDYIFEDMRFNKNLFVSGIRVNAKQINPITGLSEISQKYGSCILASPKQFLEYDAVSANRLPHARMTTGAITNPNYNSTRGNSLRTAYLAEHQHTVGAIIVEIKDDDVFFFRQIQAAEDGSFCDLGVKYSAKSTSDASCAVVFGDVHAVEVDEGALQGNIDLIKRSKPSRVVFNDLCSANSISHHVAENIVARTEMHLAGELCLEKELAITSEVADKLMNACSSVKEGIVLKSNHDEFIDRWLQSGRFVKDPVNFRIACRIAAEVIYTDKDYLLEGMKLVRPPKSIDRLRFLKVNDDYSVGGFSLSHGDKGANGAKGSIKALAKSYPAAIIGHSHTPGIFKKIFQVGTMSKLRLPYTKGASSWVHASALAYDDGQAQLINFINGEFTQLKILKRHKK